MEETLRELGPADRPRLTVLNKIDLLEGGQQSAVSNQELPMEGIPVSAAKGLGLDALRAEIEGALATEAEAQRFAAIDR